MVIVSKRFKEPEYEVELVHTQADGSPVTYLKEFASKKIFYFHLEYKYYLNFSDNLNKIYSMLNYDAYMIHESITHCNKIYTKRMTPS